MSLANASLARTSLSKACAAVLLLGAFVLAPVGSAQAQSGALTCVGSGASISCVGRLGPGTFAQIVDVREPMGEREMAEAAARDRKWLAHCEPIIRQDRNGVRRYLYAAPDCDVGRYER